MNIKQILSFIAIIVTIVASFLTYSFTKERVSQDETPNPAALWDFKTVESTAIDATTLLDEIQSEKKITLQIQESLPDNPPFMPIGWSQSDFLQVAQAYWKVIWTDDPNLWQLYKAGFYSTCDSSNNQFNYAELLYYQEITNDGARLYSVREIEVDPAYGYLAWGGDTVYPHPKKGGLINIDLGNIINVPAEKALALADQRGGNDFRRKENNVCNIGVVLWPSKFKRSDWSVLYTGITNTEIWIPMK